MFKRLDTFILWNVLQNVELENPVGYDEIAVALECAGIKTRRGNKFSARVVRACLNEMRQVGVADVQTTTNGGLLIRLTKRDEPFRATEDEQNKEGRGFFCRGDASKEPAEDENGNENENGNCKNDDGRETKRAEKSAEKSVSNSVPVFGSPRINCINKEYRRKINKKNAQNARVGNTNTGNTGNTGEARDVAPTVGDAFKGVDVRDDDAIEMRRKIVSIVWEPSLRKDLIDRAIVAIKRGFASLAEMINSAKRAAAVASKSGVKRIWQTFALDVKRAFDSAGYLWEPTTQGAEPRPTVRRVARWEFDKDDEEDDEARVFVDENGRTFVCV